MDESSRVGIAHPTWMMCKTSFQAIYASKNLDLSHDAIHHSQAVVGSRMLQRLVIQLKQ
jgi:hypothetical protein